MKRGSTHVLPARVFVPIVVVSHSAPHSAPLCPYNKGTDKKEMTKALRTQIIVSSLLFCVAVPALTLFDHKSKSVATAPATPELSAADIEASIQQISKEVKAENPPTEAEAEVSTETDRLGEWAARAHDAEQAQQDRCWDQLEERGYGDAACY